MADLFVADESSLRMMLDRWLQTCEVVGPKRAGWGDVLLEALESASQCELEFELQVAPPKEWLLPQVETLFTYELGPRTTIRETPDAASRVLFAVRPCDMSAIGILDEVMAAAPADHYYHLRRQNVTFVVLACERVFEGHFCHEAGAGPVLRTGFDWQLTRLDDRYAIEVAGQRGAALLEPVIDLVSAAEDGHRSMLAQRHAEARASRAAHLDLGRAAERLAGRKADAALWQNLDVHCQSCCGCSFICPTCWCFSIVDLGRDATSGERRRSWDSCALAEFTLMAGGRNPCEERERRIERRLRHKLGYHPGPGSRPACVGCGRCSQVCLGNMVWRDALVKFVAEGSGA